MKKKILIVDDTAAVIRLCSERLEHEGYEIYGANDGLQGLKRAKEVNPDLILLDLQMPAGGGVHTFENLKASVYSSAIPIIFITAFNEKKVKQLIMEMGADGFIPKPINFSELLKMINKLIGE